MPFLLRTTNISQAGGQVGKYVAEELVATGKFNVTAITRADSTSSIPSGLTKVNVDYEDPSSLSSALEGMDVLIITLAVTVPRDTQSKLIKAAAAAKVPWVFPNEWGLDQRDSPFTKETIIGTGIVAVRDEITSLGVSAWIAVVCGFWYEYSLSFSPVSYGFDFANKKVTFYDDGNTRHNTSTWDICGKAVAKVLQLPISSDKGPSLNDYKNDFLYISSFALSQRDMLDSIHRVQGTTDKDWMIEKEDIKKRWQDGMDEMKDPKTGRLGFAKTLYARNFFPDEPGMFEKRGGWRTRCWGWRRKTWMLVRRRRLRWWRRRGRWDMSQSSRSVVCPVESLLSLTGLNGVSEWNPALIWESSRCACNVLPRPSAPTSRPWCSLPISYVTLLFKHTSSPVRSSTGNIMVSH